MSAVWDMRWGWFSGARAWIRPHPGGSTRPLHIQTNINNGTPCCLRQRRTVNYHGHCTVNPTRCTKSQMGFGHRHHMNDCCFVLSGVWISTNLLTGWPISSLWALCNAVGIMLRNCILIIVWPSGHSFRLQNGDILCFLWGTNWIYICYVEESRPPLSSNGQSSWLHNGDVLWFLWGTDWIYICFVEESRPPLWSSGQSSWLHNGDVLWFLWGTNWIYMLCRRK
jgi:hypothetical protein